MICTTMQANSPQVDFIAAIILNFAKSKKVKDHCKITLMQVNNRINQNNSPDALHRTIEDEYI